MAPASALMQGFLAKRYYCNDGFDNDGFNNNCNSGWSNWGRWVALAVIIVFFIILAFLFSCYNSRRRRRLGRAPRYGTGWTSGWMGNKAGGQQQYGGPQGGYYPNEPYHGGAAPPYSPPVPNQATGTTFNSNDGYYGQTSYGQPGYELQEPQSAYQPQRGGDAVYEAPQGPPPKKGDGFIR